jgi:hypothetical protein
MAAMFVLLHLGCIECGNAKGTAVLGVFPTVETGIAAMKGELDKNNEPRTARGWYPLEIDQRPEIEEDYDPWSTSLIASIDGEGWAIQLHKVEA